MFVMEADDKLLPVSQKLSSVQTTLEETDFLADETLFAEDDFEYISQVCDSTCQSVVNMTGVFSDEEEDLTQGGVLPLVPYDDEENSSGSEEADFGLGFFSDLTQTGAATADPGESSLHELDPAPPAPGPMSDEAWLQSQGIDFNPEEW